MKSFLINFFSMLYFPKESENSPVSVPPIHDENDLRLREIPRLGHSKLINGALEKSKIEFRNFTPGINCDWIAKKEEAYQI